MPFPNISDIRFATIKSQCYLLDTNVWLALVSGLAFPEKKKFVPYLDFVDKILSSTLLPKPKIVLSNLQVSELVNAYLRQVAMRRYVLENNVGQQGPDYFKMIYRSTPHFATHHQLIRDEIKGYEPSLIPQDDRYTQIGPYKIIDELSPKMDYNDYYYYKLCVQLNKEGIQTAIVTHDGDFKFKDVEIITDNSTLKNLRYQP